VLIVMRHGATPDEVRSHLRHREMGYQAQPMRQSTHRGGPRRNDGRVDASRLEAARRSRGHSRLQPYNRSAAMESRATVVASLGVAFGIQVVAIAGPCSSKPSARSSRRRASKEAGRSCSAAGLEARSSPYSFQGLGKPGLRLLAKAREETDS